jgi:Domain of unknown function (DUF1998)
MNASGMSHASATIVQRGAANVFIPEIVSALTIPEAATVLHRLLGQRVIMTALLISPVAPRNKAELKTLLDRLVGFNQLSRVAADTILAHDETELMRAVGEILHDDSPQTVRQMRIAEFRSLTDAAERGYPRTPGGAQPLFEVIRSNVRLFPRVAGAANRLLRVTPVSRLRVVLVQKGYRRLDGAPVDRRSTIENDTWYPGVELFGEGLFLDLVDDAGQAVPCVSTGGDAWMAAHRAGTAGATGAAFGGEPPEHLHPVFVWWHTFSHRLITALALDCGYSSAALRERVFVEIDPASRQASGGVLIYTVQPGGDGTLGGLVSLVPDFDRIIFRALRDLDACSNDPLCGEETFRSGRVNGVACYACLYQSETACEHRNMLLDRHLLLGNLP